MAGALRAIWRGARGRCPRCGEGRLFSGWDRLEKACSACGLPLAGREADCYAFMYVSTGFITGVFLIFMLWVVQPRSVLAGQIVVGLLAVVTMGLSIPVRKGIAVAIDWLVDCVGGDGAAA